MSATSDWWQTFFTGPMVEFWLRATTLEQTQHEADFIQQMLQVAPPARVLDVPCGGGRHSLALAERGFHMTGVDLSTEFLAAARAGSVERSAQVQWEHRDMRDLPWPQAFDGAFSFGNSFGYLDDEGNAAFLGAVAAALKPGARFLLDVGYVSEALLPAFQERSWYPLGDGVLLSQRRYDHLHSRLHVEYTWIRNGRSDKRSMSARIHSYRELTQLLEASGFGDVQGYSSLSREPFRLGSSRLLMLATRTGNPPGVSAV
jgi:cyclopropane fatty-acyl-phospholipid synthase-like methyltransferase